MYLILLTKGQDVAFLQSEHIHCLNKPVYFAFLIPGIHLITDLNGEYNSGFLFNNKITFSCFSEIENLPSHTFFYRGRGY